MPFNRYFIMICFVEQDTPFRLKNRKMHKQWIKGAILSEGAVPGDLNFVFCSDPCLLEVNRKFLGHDYYTDVITFDYVEDGKISGDVMISVDTVLANSKEYGTGFDNELSRVMIHGVLHLLGYDDHNDEDVRIMREKENFYLSQLQGILKGAASH